MRTSLHIAPLVVAMLVAAPVASAQRGKDRGKSHDVTGTYDIKYEEVSSNCTKPSIALARGSLEIKKRKSQLVVDIQRFPLMFGAQNKGGKVRATSEISRSPIDGVDSKVSVAGKVDEGLIQLVFVAEYYVKGKPLCSQTWNISGQKTKTKAGKAAEAPKPDPAAAVAALWMHGSQR